ncbi:MAG: biopolymer transporter ExbD [Bacteroidales bacterium]|nr:MAG: biopolymer transporter ExbD [Bacteroidales bacterium]
MARFQRKGKGGMPAISTASLPDIVFMLLFFFMVSTTLRETSLMVKSSLPEATEVAKLEKKSLVSYIYVGPPIKSMQTLYGTEPRIQLNDSFKTLDDIRDFISSERDAMSESDRPLLTTSLKVDEETRMGIVTDIKQELRKASALKINYAARRVEKK